MGVQFHWGIFVSAFFHEGTEVSKGKKMGRKRMCRHSCRICIQIWKIMGKFALVLPFKRQTMDTYCLLLKTVNLIYILRKKSYFPHTSLPNLVFNNQISLSLEKKKINTLRYKCLFSTRIRPTPHLKYNS